jgi:thioredoxin 1
MTTLPIVSDATFAQEVEQSSGLVLVDFTAAWCGPCRIVGPILEQLAAEYHGRLRIVALDTDENPRTVARYGVRSMPTVAIFRDGREVDRLVGALPRRVFQERVDGHLAIPSAA